MCPNDEEYVLVYDCGSTNIRAVAVDAAGNIKAFSSLPNSPRQQPDGKPGWLIWDMEDIWRKICLVSREVLRVVEPRKIKAATIITWG
ncbi:MAG: FGGY family carbohydrate kinase, partial [Candidatus Bathyarchaeia archaeon]